MRALLVLPVLLALFTACPGGEPPPSETDTTTDTNPDTADTADTATDTSETANARDLCGECGGTCSALTGEGGNTYCVTVQEPWRHACQDGGFPEGDCCEDADCTGGVCAAFEIGYCGGARPPEWNTCRIAECASHAECGEGHVCLPAGAFGLLAATCAPAACTTDSDCAERPDGRCDVLSTGPCGEPRGFYCTDSDDPCRSDSDCPQTDMPRLCRPTDDGTSTQCVDNPPRP